MDTIQIKFTVYNESNHSDLGLECWFDNILFQDIFVQPGNTIISYAFTEDEDQHSLRFVLKNKTQEHTKLDQKGNIIKDSIISIKDLYFDEIKMDQMLVDHGSYTHDFNGTGDTVHEKFYGHLGCNGSVELKFNTPFYMWLLENM